MLMQYIKIQFIVIGIGLTLGLIFSSCRNNSKAAVYEEQCVVADTGRIYQTVDSTRLTKELEKVQKLIVKYLKVENNHLIMSLTKEQFLQYGVSGHYYDQIIDDIKRANHRIDSLNIKNTKEILQESYKDLYAD